MKKKVTKRNVTKKRRIQYIILFICFIIIFGFLGYLLINYIGSSKISYNNNINGINVSDNDVYVYDDVKVFKGKSPDNYLYFSNMLWRIVSINKDGSLDIMVNDYINILKNKNYDVNKYINDVFLDSIDNKYLVKTSYCNDVVTKISKVKCKSIYIDDYVKLPSIQDVINSLDNGESYLLDGNEYWLNNKYKNNPFVIYNNKIMSANEEDAYQVRPIVRLSSGTPFERGDGSIDNPYVVLSTNDKFSVGNYVKLGDDLWVIYDVYKDRMNLALVSGLSLVNSFGTSSKYDIESGIAKYLNNIYFDKLSYKNILLDNEWKTGKYVDSYLDVRSDTTTSKVGMLNIQDLKLVNQKWGYYLITPNGDDEVYFYNVGNFTSNVKYFRKIVPTICIKNNYKFKGMGTSVDPFIVEV